MKQEYKDLLHKYLRKHKELGIADQIDYEKLLFASSIVQKDLK